MYKMVLTVNLGCMIQSVRPMKLPNYLDLHTSMEVIMLEKRSN